MATKRKTLPKDFESVLADGDLDAMLAVFDSCELDAYGGSYKSTALGLPGCPPELARELVARGLDVDAPDSYGAAPLARQAGQTRDPAILETLLDLGADIERQQTARDRSTALHAAAGHRGDISSVRTLIARGARVDAAGDRQRTPLTVALLAASDGDRTAVVKAAEKARLLLDAGAKIGSDDARYVASAGRAIEFHRRPDTPMPDVDAALAELYRMFDVAPVPPRVVHDGIARITVDSGDVAGRYRELWDLLVPAQGPAATVQGEVIRIVGRLGREILDNGSVNWDADFRTMTDALVAHLGSLVAADPIELADLGGRLRTGAFDQAAVDRLTDVSVAWVLANPDPLPLPAPAYKR